MACLREQPLPTTALLRNLRDGVAGVGFRLGCLRQPCLLARCAVSGPSSRSDHLNSRLKKRQERRRPRVPLHSIFQTKTCSGSENLVPRSGSKLSMMPRERRLRSMMKAGQDKDMMPRKTPARNWRTSRRWQRWNSRHSSRSSSSRLGLHQTLGIGHRKDTRTLSNRFSLNPITSLNNSSLNHACDLHRSLDPSNLSITSNTKSTSSPNNLIWLSSRGIHSRS
mmetsp:Transcript_103614/g.186950  ORF Transcript_103614/g.186950 Transcript_103614/m.186950 type:complete len:223 (-) Transcript_103614:1723-2391(-)